MDNHEIFIRLQDHLHRYDLRNGYVDMACPFCGTESTRSDPHFGFNDIGYRCFVCDSKGGLQRLAEVLRVPGFDGTDLPPVKRINRPRQKPAPPPPGWLARAEELVAEYEAHPQRFELWDSYKPVHDEIIIKHRFGVGTLPGQMHGGPRLTVPLIRHGQIVGLVGRSIDGTEPKWWAPRGSRRPMWNLDSLYPDCTVWICENYADAAWASGPMHDIVFLATGMARAVNDEEVALFRETPVKEVIVAMDNDLAGQAQGLTRKLLEEEWRREKGIEPPKQGAGERSVEKLSDAGIPAKLYEWPGFAPPKADLGWVLEMAELAREEWVYERRAA